MPYTAQLTQASAAIIARNEPVRNGSKAHHRFVSPSRARERSARGAARVQYRAFIAGSSPMHTPNNKTHLRVSGWSNKSNPAAVRAAPTSSGERMEEKWRIGKEKHVAAQASTQASQRTPSLQTSANIIPDR